jgi:DNA modification methylase
MSGTVEITIPEMECCLGLEPSPEAYVGHMVLIFKKIWRVLRDDGTFWLNLGDSYSGVGHGWGGGSICEERDSSAICGGAKDRRPVAGLKVKDLIGIPWRVSLALQADGWYLRSDIIWNKSNSMPESVTDRPTKSHEYLFLLTKSERYFYDTYAIREPYADDSLERAERGRSANHKWSEGGPGNQTIAKDSTKACSNPYGRNKRTVWSVPTKAYKGAHFAIFPPTLIEPCILAGTSAKGCCAECGEPWKRVIVKTGHINQREKAHVPNNTDTKTDSTRWVPTTRANDRWELACKCEGGDTVPCTVIDTFNGSGTTGVVTLRNGRNYEGIEAKKEYCAMSKERIDKEAAQRPLGLVV